MISITPSAAEHLRGLLAEKGSLQDHGLRLSVEKGGCAGLQYVMKVDLRAAEDLVRAITAFPFSSMRKA